MVAVFAVTAGHASADRVNFAKFQAVSASGNSSTYVADFAVDGLVSNFHAFRTNDTNTPHWLEVNYPRMVEIGSAHLYLGLDNDPSQGGLPSFKLQFHDGTGWADIPGASITGNADAERTVIFTAAVSSDRFRLHSDENGIRVIREIALFPPNLSGGVEQGFPIGTDVNLSLTHMRPAEGTTIHSGAFPKRAVDGYVDDTSRWVSSNLAEQSIVIDLLIPHAIGSAGKLTSAAATWNELDVFVGTVRNTSALRQTVIDAQNAVAAADPNVFTIDGHSGLSVLTVDDWGGSGVHYDTAGQVMLGERFAAAAISRIDSGVLVSESDESTTVIEGGDSDSYTLQLTRAPSADVTIHINPDSEVSTSHSTLTFTTSDWATPQTVTVTAVDDIVIEPNHTGTISHSLSSSDLSFGGLPINGVVVSIIDNDVNLPPVLAAIPPQSVRQGNPLNFTASASDPNEPADTLTYSLIGGPAGAEIDPVTGDFAWTPTTAETFTFSVRVSDGSLTHEQPVSVTVTSPLPSAVLDTDGDGLSDLLEYAFVTDSGIPNGNPFRLVGSGGDSATLEFPWNWNATGLIWQVRHGQDLANIAALPVIAPVSTHARRDGLVDHMTVTLPMNHSGHGFYILEVIGN